MRCQPLHRLLLVFLILLYWTSPILAASPEQNQNDTATYQDDPFDPFAEDEAVLVVNDPLESVNRGIFWFNDKLYFYLLKPVARGFRVIPEPARVSIDNFFSNLATPVRFSNNLLQLKLDRAGTELGRFLVNSTVGLLGLFDPGKSWLGLEKADEDLGQTLGSYGVGEGIYLVLPLFGPSNLRDGIGRLGDYFIDPLGDPFYLELTTWETYSLLGVSRTNALSLDKDTYEGVKKDALDPYLFLRSAYSQMRQSRIKK